MIKYNVDVDFTTNSYLKLKGYIKIKNRELYIKFFIFLYLIILRDYHSHFLKLQEGRGQVGPMAMVSAAGPQWFASDQMDWWRNISSVGVNRTLRGYPRPAIPNPTDKKMPSNFCTTFCRPVFRIRIHLIQIRHFRLNVDPDPGFWWPKIKKNLQLKKKLNNFWSKIAIYLSLGLHKGLPNYRRSLQPSKENIQHIKTWNFLIFSIFVGHFCSPGSGFRIRIRIHWQDWIRIRIRNTAVTAQNWKDRSPTRKPKRYSIPT